MDDRQNLSQPESVITTTEKSPSRNLQKKTCTAPVKTTSGMRLQIARAIRCLLASSARREFL
jgi:hypothetical protein